MALKGNRLAFVVASIVLGLYFALDHTYSPFSHEALGIGTMHSIHTVFGIILLVIAGAVLYTYRSSKSKK